MTRERVPNGMLLNPALSLTTAPGPSGPVTVGAALTVTSYMEQPQIAKPANPAAGSMRFYPKSDGIFYSLNSAGVEKPMGGVTWPLLAPDGTPAAPSYSFAAETGAGIYRSAKGVTLLSATAEAHLIGKTTAELGANAYNNGTDWLRVDTAANALATNWNATGFVVYTALAAANPITNFVQRLALTLVGTTGASLQIGPTGQYVRNPANSTSHLSLESTTGYMFVSAGLNSHIASNLYWDGTSWMRYSTASPGAFLGVNNASMTMNFAVAAANPATFTAKFTFDGVNPSSWTLDSDTVSGRLTIGPSYGIVRSLSGNLYLRATSGTVILDTGGVSISSTLTVSGAFTMSGGTINNHTMMSMATGGIGTTAGSEGQLELQNAGSGAAKIAFHRTGAYAAYFGIDTDNLWAVGGWSMGGSRYRVILGDGFSNGGALTMGGRITSNADGVFTTGVFANNHYMGMSGSYYLTLSNSNYVRSVAMHIMSDGVFAFNANTAINLSSDNSNIASSHRFLAPNFSVGNGGSYQMIDTNVRIARPAGTNIMYIYAYDAQWAFIRTPDSVNVGYVDNGGFHSISKLKHKTNIVPIRDGLKLVCDPRVTPISYAVKGYKTPDTPSLGFSAEDMATVVPSAVGHDDEGPASINYGSLVAVLWDAVRTLNNRIEALENAA